MRCATEAEATGTGDSGILSEWIGGVGQMTVLGTRLPIEDVRASSATEGKRKIFAQSEPYRFWDP